MCHEGPGCGTTIWRQALHRMRRSHATGLMPESCYAIALNDRVFNSLWQTPQSWWSIRVVKAAGPAYILSQYAARAAELVHFELTDP